MKLVKLMPRRYREALFALEIACPGPVEAALSERQRFWPWRRSVRTVV